MHWKRRSEWGRLNADFDPPHSEPSPYVETKRKRSLQLTAGGDAVLLVGAYRPS